MTKKFHLIILLILLFIFISLILNTVVKNYFSNKSPQSETSLMPTQSPIPFYDLTVSYLRSRNYQSSLGNLEKVSDNQNYTSYLTSYNSDGLKINGLLVKPKGLEPEDGWPAIVFIHGYIPPAAYKTTQNYNTYVNFLARKGFVVFKIDLRGHDNSEGEPGGAYFSPDYVIDVLNAHAALQSADFVNSQKIGLWGHSMAGNLVMRTMAVKPEIPAAVIWAGAVYTYVDFVKYGIADNSFQPLPTDSVRGRRRRQLFETYGQPSADSEFWKQVVPTSYLSDLKGAIQIHHATLDPVVNIGYSRNLNKLLDQTSVPHEFYEYQSGGHNLTGTAFTQAMQRTVKFYRDNL